MRGAQDGLPAGVCGQVEGIALPYDVIDSYGTTFSRGCLSRTVRERVAAGKVRHFFDHGDVPMHGMYDTHLHIGTVREVWDEQIDGQWVAKFRADIFDTEAGRATHEYLTAVAATSSETGVSIGMLKEPTMTRCLVNGQEAFRIDEVALGEISITAMPSVPGARVTAVRADVAPIDAIVHRGGLSFTTDTPTALQLVDSTLSTTDYLNLLDGIVAHVGVETVRAHLGATVSNAEGEHSDAATASNGSTDSDSSGVSRTGTEPASPPVPAEERLALYRANLPRLYQ
jgi:hypothetical protein